MKQISNIDYFDKVSSNIQHNENIRNRMFQFYLAITGIFVVFFREVNTIEFPEIYLISALFVWVIGFAFLWAYQRIIEMISRDNKIISHIRNSLLDGNELDKKIYQEYDIYNKTYATDSLKWWSISSCITLTTSLISAILLASGILLTYQLNKYWLILLTISILLINRIIIYLMNRLIKSKAKKTYYQLQDKHQ